MLNWDVLVNNVIIPLVFIVLYYLLITVAWSKLEVMMYGEVTPKALHDLIAILLAISLYFNTFGKG